MFGSQNGAREHYTIITKILIRKARTLSAHSPEAGNIYIFFCQITKMYMNFFPHLLLITLLLLLLLLFTIRRWAVVKDWEGGIEQSGIELSSFRAHSHQAICTVPEYVFPLKCRSFGKCEHANCTQVRFNSLAWAHCAQATVQMLMSQHMLISGYLTWAGSEVTVLRPSWDCLVWAQASGKVGGGGNGTVSTVQGNFA